MLPAGATVAGWELHPLKIGHLCTAHIDTDFSPRFFPNLSDFPAETLARFDLKAQHPDDFLGCLLDLGPGVVCAAVQRQRESLRNPPKTAEELLATLESQGLTQSVARVRQFIDLL